MFDKTKRCQSHEKILLIIIQNKSIYNNDNNQIKGEIVETIKFLIVLTVVLKIVNH